LGTADKQTFVAGMAAKYGGRLRRFLKLNLANAADVPDLAQEVFMRLLRVQRYEEIRSPEAYLFTVASHVVQQHAQKQATLPESLEVTELLTELQLISDDDPTARVEVQQRLQHLEHILEQLPPHVAMTLLLHRLAGNSIAEIAHELGVAQITVKKYLAKALLHCRDVGEAGKEVR
jgi:RNA polymerase sigma factor (sigma-70 family)